MVGIRMYVVLLIESKNAHPTLRVGVGKAKVASLDEM
jgi:hypothetical protein